MKALHDLYAFGWFAAYLGLGVLMLQTFVQVYIWVTPYDDRADINAGKLPAAITLVGAKLGFTFPLLAASYAGSSLLDYVMWSVVAGVVQLLWFKLSFWSWTSDKTTGPYNVAHATVLAGTSACVGLIQAFSMIP